MSEMNIAFFGTPELAQYVAEELFAGGIRPSVVVTAPDRPAGRKLELKSPAMKTWAMEHDIVVLQPDSLKNPQDLDVLANTQWGLFIVAAYNIIIPKWLLDLPTHGVLNVHPSLLPKNRGPSPVRTAIKDNNPDAVGVTIIALDEQMDHGPIVAQATVELPEWPVPGGKLEEILFREGGRLLVEVVPKWVRGEIPYEDQQHKDATYTEKIRKADGEISLEDDDFESYCKYCAYDGWPGIFFFYDTKSGKKVRVKVKDASYSDGKFVIKTVIPEGKKEVDFSTWRNSVS